MNLRDLLAFNLLLQFFDGLVSYQAFSVGAVEANPLVVAAIINWGVIWGLLYHKILACVLLLLIFAFGYSRRLLVTRALTVTAWVYSCVAVTCLWEVLR